MKKILIISLLLFLLFINPLGSINNININISELKVQFKKEKILLRTEERDKIKYKDWNDIPIICPISLSHFKGISSDYGIRIHPIFHIKAMHNGIDIVANKGTPVLSTANGIIKKIRYSRFGYGNYVLIKHNLIYSTLYAHLNTINVKVNDTIKVKQVIGTVGSTGLSTGPHLHYEILKDGKTIDPMIFTYDSLNQRSILNYYSNLIALNN